MALKIYTNGKQVLEFFPEAYIRLQKELATGLHEVLCENLAKQPIDELDVKLAIIASHCNVLLDGVYTLKEREKLCDILVQKLIEIRKRGDTIILLQ